VRLHLPLIAVVLTAAAARTAIFVWIEQPSSRAALARMGSYLVVQFEVVWRYLALLAAPLSQSVLHVIGPSPRVSLLGAIALAGACLVVFRYRRAEPVLALGAAWFLLVLAPSSSLVPLQYAMAEHRTYLASVGVFLVAGAAVAAVDRRLASHPVARWAGVMALVVLLGTMSALTFARNQVWADPVGLWADAHRKSPSWQTSLALGDALRQQGDCDAAIDAYRDAVRRAPKRRSPYVRLHACLVREGRVAEAGEVVQEMRRLDPDFTKLCEEERALSAGRMNVEECRRRYRTRLGPA
ncbi:MAG TPA: hypothetical protein VNN07_17490, partial [Candidatus Tectomicrobia bacterium]|nr:hypothetical protein [Candidatus Tectomicrobia bacterium]